MSTSRRTEPLPPDWDMIRGYVLRRDPICRWGSIPEDMAEPNCCQERSNEVDHIGPASVHDVEWLRGLCQRHHGIRTGRQGAAAKTATMLTRKRPPDKHPGYR